jgi:hypothetical protein
LTGFRGWKVLGQLRKITGMSRTLLLTAAPVVALFVLAAVAVSQPRAGQGSGSGDAPASRPASNPSPDDVLGNMLKPRRTTGERELVPTEAPAVDKKTGPGSVAPKAPTLTVLREGTPIINRVGRLSLGADGAPSEFVFESDGQALRDPPLVLVPNLKLMIMEDVARGNTREPRFRVSGVVTEYRGRNYLLLEKVYVINPANQQYR